MTFPVYIEIGSTRILLHAITEVASIFIGFRYFLYLRRKKGDIIPSQNRLWILIAAIFGAVLGSRLLGGFENPEALAGSSNKLLYFYQNKTVLGGFLGGLWAVETVKYFIGEKENSGDLFTYPIILGLILGRIGCFSMGVFEETYGLPTTGFTGIYLGDPVKRHPVALYEILLLILLWVVIWSLERKYEFCSGVRFKLFMLVYITFRLFLDFIKPHYTWSIGLSSIQIASLAGLVYYYKYIIFPSKLVTARKGTPK